MSLGLRHISVSDWERKPADSYLKQMNGDVGDLTSCDAVLRYILNVPIRLLLEIWLHMYPPIFYVEIRIGTSRG